MKIPVLGMDPSLRNWGLAEAILDLHTGELSTPRLTLVQTKDDGHKQVRKNSTDLARAEELAKAVMEASGRAKAVFVEVPVGSQSARAMASYGVCVGVLGAVRASGIQLIEVSPTEVKKFFTGDKTASKDLMIRTAVELYPNANWPRHPHGGKTFAKGDLMDKSEHLADAIATIHAGVHTPLFQQLRALYSNT